MFHFEGYKMARSTDNAGLIKSCIPNLTPVARAVLHSSLHLDHTLVNRGNFITSQIIPALLLKFVCR